VLKTNILGGERTVEIGNDGTLLEPLTLTNPSGRFTIDLKSGSRLTNSDDVPITRVEVTEIDETVNLPDDTIALSSIYKVTGYINDVEIPEIHFDPAARLTILYDPRNLPENAFAPYIANYTEKEGWTRLEPPSDSFFEIGKAKAMIKHASLFAAVTELALPPPPLPAEFTVSNLTIDPVRTQMGEPVIINITITNEGEVTGDYEMYLIIDGIVRATKEITLTGNSVETVSFEVSNLAAGKHQVKVAGLNGEFQVIQAAVTLLPTESTIGWILTDLSVGVVIVSLLLALYMIVRRSRRLQQGQPDNIQRPFKRDTEE